MSFRWIDSASRWLLAVATVLPALAGCAPSSGPAPDAAADAVTSDTPATPTLTLAPGQPSSCPASVPGVGTTCTTVETCSYNYPAGYHPSGCDVMCVAGDGGGMVWYAPPCI